MYNKVKGVYPPIGGYFYTMPPNSGSFGNAIGGGQFIKAAMAQRGMGAPVTAQVSPTAPSFNLQTAPQPASPMPGMRPMTPQPSQPKQPMDQESIIVQALVKQLERIDKGKQMSDV